MDSTPVQPAYTSNPFELFKPSLGVLRRNLVTLLKGFLLVIAVLLMGGTFLALALQFIPGRWGIGAAIVIGIILLIGAVFVAPMFSIVLLHSAKGQNIGLRAVLEGCKRYSPRVFWAHFLSILAIIGGFILLIVPGIIFAVWFSLTTYVIIDQDVSAMEAMRRSRQLVRGRVWEMMGLFAFPLFFEFIALIPVVGSVIVGVINFLYSGATTIRYLQLKPLQEEDAVKPPTDSVNYALVVAAIVVLVLVGWIQSNEKGSTSSASTAQLAPRNAVTRLASGR